MAAPAVTNAVEDQILDVQPEISADKAPVEVEGQTIESVSTPDVAEAPAGN